MNMIRHSEVEKLLKPIEFIEALRNSDDYIGVIYTTGGCYQFAKILKLMHPKAVLYKVKPNRYEVGWSHVITKIAGKYYDITGEVKLDNYYGYEQVCESDIEMLESWSFCKKAWLSKTCPYCDEEIPYEIEAS